MEPLETPRVSREVLGGTPEEASGEPECPSFVENFGRSCILAVTNLGDFSFFVVKSLAALVGLRSWISKVVRAIFEMGVRCIPIIITVGCFAGLILGLQGYRTLARFGETTDRKSTRLNSSHLGIS